MLSTREIKRKIRTVRNIQQLCRAMKTVSLVKLQKAETRLPAARAYAERMGRSLASLSGELPESYSSEAGQDVVMVVSSDKGLAGGYNATILRAALRAVDSQPVIPVGRKSERLFRRRANPVFDILAPLGAEPTLADVIPLANRLAKHIENGEIASLTAIYSRFLHGTRSEITTREIFPLQGTPEEVILEPDAPQLAQLLVGRYLKAILYAIVLEASASEHGARVAAMTAASDNAEEMIAELTMDYNKARQAMITKELSEIVSSAEALR